MSPCSLEIRAHPDSARGNTSKPALTLEESCSSSCYSIKLWGICSDSNCVAVCFGGEKEGQMCCLEKNSPQYINEQSWAPKPLWHLQFSWEHSSFTQAQGFYPEQDSDLRDKMDVFSLCTLAAPILAGWLQVQSNMEQNTVFLIKIKIHSWHCIRWVPKAFQEQMKRLMAPSWGAAAPSSIHCQYGQPDQGRGCVVTEAPEPQAT